METIWQARRDADIEGNYFAYLFKQDRGDVVDYDNQSAVDKITFERKNVFGIVHNETNGNIWEGSIYLSSPRDGYVVWAYTKLDGESPTKKHRAGFRRCVIKNTVNRKGKTCRMIFMIGERPDYGNEYFERQESEN